MTSLPALPLVQHWVGVGLERAFGDVVEAWFQAQPRHVNPTRFWVVVKEFGLLYDVADGGVSDVPIPPQVYPRLLHRDRQFALRHAHWLAAQEQRRMYVVSCLAYRRLKDMRVVYVALPPTWWEAGWCGRREGFPDLFPEQH